MQYVYQKVARLDQLDSEIRASNITIALDFSGLVGETLIVYFKAALSVEDEATLSTIVENHVPLPLTAEVPQVSVKEFQITGVNKIPKVAAFEPEGDSATIVSHDFTDKCSWYWGSLTSTAEALSTSDNLTYASAHTHWIDLRNGRLYDEDNVNVGGTYNPHIFVDGVEVTTGFTINYPAGTVTFEAESTGAVTATYKYAGNSYYVLKPKPGKILSIRTAEVQFTQDVQLASPFVFEPWINHPTLGLIPVPGAIAYKNAKDFMSACNGGTSWIEPWAGITKKVHVFPFGYARPKPLIYSQGVEIRVYVKDHQEVVGEFATCTFYVTVENE